MFRRLAILAAFLSSMLQAQIPTNGLAVYYPFNGNTNDASGNGRDCIVNGATFATDRFKVANRALHFDGFTNYVLVGKILDSVFCAPVAKFTIAGWANTEMLPYYQGGDAIIAKAAGGTLGPYQWAVSHDIDGRLKGFVSSDSEANDYIEKRSVALSLGRWFHFALIFDGSLDSVNRVQFYVNDQAGAVSRTLGVLGTSTKQTEQWITIGASHHASNPLYPGNLYRGSIDDIRIYSRALNSSEIDQLFHEGNWPAVSVERVAGIPEAFSLAQNYPNPFNPSTTITFSIPRTSRVILTIVDALGRTQAVLMNEERSAGTYQTVWNANVPSGVYFYRLQAGDYMETKKMILLK